MLDGIVSVYAVCQVLKLISLLVVIIVGDSSPIQVYQAGRFILLRVEALPATPPPGCRVSIALE